MNKNLQSVNINIGMIFTYGCTASLILSNNLTSYYAFAFLLGALTRDISVKDSPLSESLPFETNLSNREVFSYAFTALAIVFCSNPSTAICLYITTGVLGMSLANLGQYVNDFSNSSKNSFNTSP